VPPHVEYLRMSQRIKEELVSVAVPVNTLKGNLVEAENLQFTLMINSQAVSQCRYSRREFHYIKEHTESLVTLLGSKQVPVSGFVQTSILPTTAGMYHWGARFWSVPEDYALPKNIPTIQAWRLWILGQPGHRIEKVDGTNMK